MPWITSVKSNLSCEVCGKKPSKVYKCPYYSCKNKTLCQRCIRKLYIKHDSCREIYQNKIKITERMSDILVSQLLRKED